MSHLDGSCSKKVVRPTFGTSGPKELSRFHRDEIRCAKLDHGPADVLDYMHLSLYGVPIRNWLDQVGIVIESFLS